MLSTLAVVLLSACGGGDKNSPPVFSQAVYNVTGYEDTVITGQVSATDSDGDAITYSVSNAASHGVLRINADGTFAYTPNKDYFGSDEVTVTASDSKASTSAKIVFDIINVNDAPVLVRTEVTSAANGITIGQIIVTDADNDPITFSIITGTQYGTLDLNSQSGEFTYTPYDLELRDDSFVVGFTDGIIEAPVEATIPLIPQFTTNADKLNYYYSSEFSHLKKAEEIVDSINDGVAINQLNSKLAQGYLLSGFLDKANALLEQGIDNLAEQAEAYKDAAKLAASQNQTALAITYNQQSQRLYSQFIQERGTENLTQADSSFLTSIIKNYMLFEDFQSARQLTDYMLDEADKIAAKANGIYDGAHAYFVTSFNQYSTELLEIYLEDKTPENKANLLSALDSYARLAEQTGLHATAAYAVKAMQLSNVVKRYESVGELDKAKEYLAKAISIYSAVSYDPAYVYPADNYATDSLTSASARTQLSTLSGLFETLYPSLPVNIPQQLLLENGGTDAQLSAAEREIARYSIYNRIIAGDDIAATITDIKATFNGTIIQFVTTLAVDNAQGQSVASRLYINNLQSAAVQVLTEALNILGSSEYNSSSTTAQGSVTGESGCYGIAKTYKQYGGNLAAAAAVCQNLTDTYFQADSVPAQTTTRIVTAYRDLISVYGLFDDASASAALQQAATELDTNILKFADVNDQINRYMVNTPDLASIGAFDLARQFMNKGLALIDQRLADDVLTAAQLKTIIDVLRVNIGNLYDSTQTTPSRNYVNYIKALRRAPGIENYPAKLANVYEELKKRVVVINIKAKNYAINEQQGFASSLVNLNLSADMIAEAHAIVDDPITAAAEKITFLKTIGIHHSLLDHFPGTDVANVDSDNDGKPNFFFLHKTAAEIAASGLIADDDSDGDGVPDTNDLFPLDPAKS
ncbi:cadherin-like domain-containing protein [Chromatiaceae bacterium AAb-1]|nr:cadherin-like domain-containing protein [Chromatiaceae bacterium AAb-1]